VSNPAGPVRVVLADDHPVVRRGLAALLWSVEGIEVVGQASSGLEAVREAQLLAPDVVLMDVRMPDLDGVEASRRIAATNPRVAVLVLTMHDDDETVFAAVRAGARGYLLKGAEQEEIRRAIHAVVAGEMIFAPGVTGHLLARLSGRRRRARSRRSPRASGRSWTGWRRAGRTARSPPSSRWPRRPSATTCRRSSPSSASPPGPRPS